MDASTNRYANDWNSYSADWNRLYGSRYRHLGDEWCDDGSAGRSWESRLFAQSIEPLLTPVTRAVEIGPGGGKWTVRLAPRVAHLLVFDVAEAMLERTRQRVAAEEFSNVSFQLGNGRDLEPIPSGSVDLVFSYDVFVHIALEDTVAYVAEFGRVLRRGGAAIVHHAIADVQPAWDRIESHNDWYRERPHSLGQYYYYSREVLDRMYARFGLVIESAWTDYCTSVLTVRKPADSIVPQLEQVLRQAATADSGTALDAAIEGLAATGRDLADRLGAAAAALRNTPVGPERYAIVQQIRKLIRG